MPAAASPEQAGETDAHQSDASGFRHARNGADGTRASMEVGDEYRAIQNVIVHVAHFELDRVLTRGKNLGKGLQFHQPMRIGKSSVGIRRGQRAGETAADLNGLVGRVEDDLICRRCAVQKCQKCIRVGAANCGYSTEPKMKSKPTWLAAAKVKATVRLATSFEVRKFEMWPGP